MPVPTSTHARAHAPQANPIPVKWAMARMDVCAGGIRLPLAPLGDDYHTRVTAALTQAGCIESKPSDQQEGGGSFGWPSRTLLLQGHLFDQSLINQALELIEKRGGDFEIVSFSSQPNDQYQQFNFKRTSSVVIKLFAVNVAALEDITTKLQQLVNVLESAEGSLTEIPEEVAA